MKDQKIFRPDPLISPDPAFELSLSWNQREDHGIIIEGSLGDSENSIAEETLSEMPVLTKPVAIEIESSVDSKTTQVSEKIDVEENKTPINAESGKHVLSVDHEPVRDDEVPSAITDKEHTNQDLPRSKVVPSSEAKQENKLPNEAADKIHKIPKMSAPNTDRSDFNRWLSGLRPLKREEPIIPVTKATASKSVSKSQTVGGIYGIDASAATETLAQLLTQQGYKAEAISIYEKLSIRFPEKKDTFADLIQKLKN